MISTKLIDDISPHLKQAEEIWIAVALMNDSGFNKIQEMVPESATQHYLVGINLPTTPTVLKALQSKQSEKFHASIYKSTENFHPKVYVIKKQSEFVAFVGSSNLTDGGLFQNTELNFITSDKAICLEITDWFRSLQKQSYPLTDENIQSYTEQMELISERNDEIKQLRNKVKLKRLSLTDDLLLGIDFSDRFFKREHHLAFRKDLWRDTTLSANKEREKTAKRFLELNEIIFPRFREYGLSNLHTNVANHIVSLSYQNPNRIQNMDAMWLSYGKSQQEIKEYHKLFPKTDYTSDEDDLQSFINHARIQIRLELEEIGIWILFGKNNNGSLFDRQHFLDNMKQEDYRTRFYNLFKALPPEYWITVNKTTRYVTEFDSAETIYDFCRKDRPENYFIIGRNYEITADEMSEKSLPKTTLVEFKRLHPIYNMMKDSRFAK